MRLAQRIEAAGGNAVVLNADSAQVYCDLRVLSARPSTEEMEGIEHRLFGEWDGAEACSAADWAAAAKREIAALHAAGAVPILVGGSGLYLRTLLDGIAPVPEIDTAVRTAVRALLQPEARAALEREDPAGAAHLAAADTSRTMRALEVIRSTGKPLAAWQGEKTGGIGESVQLSAAVLLPDRDWLFARCDRRFAVMLDGGAPEEVTALLARKLDSFLPVMRAIGVREVSSWLSGARTREETLSLGQTATRHYAKRQYTWFRHQPPAHWLRLKSQNCYKGAIQALLLQIDC